MRSSGRATHGPRFKATTRSTVGGRGADTDADSSTNSWISRNRSAAFDERSRPIVDERSGLILVPHSEPATCPG
jgi:hypothetical protein